MKKVNLITSLFLFLFLATQAQENPTIKPYSSSHYIDALIPSIQMPSHDFTQDIAEAEALEAQGSYPRFAKTFDVNRTMLNSGTWTELPNGDRLWRLALKSEGALATCLFFDDFWIPEGGVLHVYSPNKKQIFGSYTHLDNQGNNLFSTEFLKGEQCIIEYYESVAARGLGKLRITSLAHQYRELQRADDCQVNVICSEGNNWQDEKRGVVRIQVNQGGSIGFCSGSLINNTALDCKRYILTAFHCGETSSTANFNQWKFYFNYEATQCTGQSDNFGITTNVFTGCTKRADSDDGGGSYGSDFLLVQMNSSSSPSWWGNGSNIYWNGWSRVATAPASGAISIHHPSGDNKKISKTSATATSVTWGGPTPNTHWRVYWAATTNGWGVTEGGSSGSPLFNTAGLIVGTLTGGSSYCESVQPNGQYNPDAYGKLSYHWTSNGTSSNRQLKPWLDPINSGVTTLSGTFNPCNSVGITENNNNLEQQVSIYPNPNNGLFNVNVKFEQPTDIEITVYNFLGQQIETKKITNSIGGSFETDLSKQISGIYFIDVKTPVSHETQKVIVNK